MIIRSFRRQDFKNIIYLYETGYEEVKKDKEFGDYLLLKRPSKRTLLKKIANRYKEMLNGNVLHYIVEENHKIIGYSVVTKKDIPDSEMSHVGVLGLRIAKDYRRMGIGKKLMEYTLKKCKGKFEIIDVYILGFNNISRHLCKKFGFKTWGTAPGYVKRNGKYIDMVYMYLKL